MHLWHILHRLTLLICTDVHSSVAERVGFEPTVPLVAVHSISNRALSTSSAISPNQQQYYALIFELFFSLSINLFWIFSFLSSLKASEAIHLALLESIL